MSGPRYGADHYPTGSRSQRLQILSGPQFGEVRTPGEGTRSQICDEQDGAGGGCRPSVATGGFRSLPGEEGAWFSLFPGVVVGGDV